MTSAQRGHYSLPNVLLVIVLLSPPKTSATTYFTLGVFVPLSPLGPRQLGNLSIEAVKWTVDRLHNSECVRTHDIRFKYVVDDTQCDSQVALCEFFQRATEKDPSAKLDALIGGACDDVCQIIGGMVGDMEIPMISYGCGSEAMSDRKYYETFLRTSSNFSAMEIALEAYLKHYKWDRVTFVHLDDTLSWLDTADEFYDFLIHKGFEVRHLTNRIKTTLEDDIRKESQFTRVFVLCTYEKALVDFMERAKHLGLLNGEYIFIALDFTNAHKINTDWVINPALNGIVDLTLSVNPGDDLYGQFVRDILQATVLPYTADWTRYFEIGIHMGLISDAISLYANAVCACLEEGGDARSMDCLGKHLYNTSMEGVTGTVIIDEGGNRVAPLGFYNIQNGSYVPVARYNASTGLEMLQVVTIWPGGSDIAPKGHPPCGWQGELCDEFDHLVLGVLAIPFAILLLVIYAVYRCIRRRMKLKKMLTSQWKIPYTDLVKPSVFSAVFSDSGYSMDTLDDIEDSDISHASSDSLFTRIQERENVYFYNGQVVYAKPIKKSNVAQSFPLTKEINQIRQLEHRNVNPLLGACVDVGRVLLISVYTSKGSLFDFLHPEIDQKPKLDVTFIASFTSDIVKGMKYLHESLVGYHGRLTSKNIFLDSHYICKIGDVHMDLLREGEKIDKTSPDYLRSQFWSAPEVLRSEIANDKLTTAAWQRADVYSFAVVLYEILTRHKPYHHEWDNPGHVLEIITRQHTTQVVRPDLHARFALHAHSKENPQVAYLRSSRRLIVSTVDLPRPTSTDGDLISDHFRQSHLGLHQDESETIPQLEDMMHQCWVEDPLLRPSFSELVRRMKRFGKNNIVENLIHMLTKTNENLEKRVDKKTQELKAERDKMKDLLHEMLPRTVADQLLTLGGNRRPPPESFDCVTIFFADVVGFVTLANRLQPGEVFDLLNRVYRHFDTITRAHLVYKVETVGDAYMVASGLPERHDKHAEEIATLSLNILSGLRPCVLQLPQLQPGQPLQLRIGIHSGPVVAGIVGLKMPRYCLCGDTVNTAARMESSSMALRIHVSPTTKELLSRSGLYHLQERGPVEMKGKPKMITYWLLGKEGFDRPLPDLRLAVPASEHTFK